MPVPESRLVGWTIESNDKGQWALFVRTGYGSVATQLSPWFETQDELVDAIKKKFSMWPS